MIRFESIVPARQESSNAFFYWTDRLAFLLLCFYTAENAIGCSGRWLSFGSLSIRMLLFGCCLILTLPRVISQMKDLIRLPYLWVLAAFAVILAVSAAIGLHNGNNRSFLFADITSLLSFALLPGVLVTVNSRERMKTLLKVVFYSTAILALCAVTLHFIIAFLTTKDITALNDWINRMALGGLAKMPTGVQRIYLRSQIFLQVSLLFGIWMLKGKHSKIETGILWVSEIIMLFAMILTYTRGFWLALGVTAVLFFVIFIREWKHCLKCAGILAVSLIVMLGGSWIAYRTPSAAVAVLERFDPSLIVIMPSLPSEEPEPSEEEGDAFTQAVVLRSETLVEQMRYIEEHPILGNGLGKNLDGLRTDGKTEYMYQDLWMKTGMIGLVLFLLSCFWPVGFLMRTYWKTPKEQRKGLLDWNSDFSQAVTWGLAVFGIAITSYVNPFLTTPMGILVVLFTAAAVNLCLQNNAFDGKRMGESK